MKSTARVAVCSRSFSANPVLREELLQRFQHVTFNDSGASLTGDGLVRFLQGHDRAIIALETIDDGVLARLPDLRILSKYGVGLDSIDADAVRARGKQLRWTPGVNRRSVAELVIAFAISLLRRVPASSREVVSGIWRQHVGEQLSGSIFGVIGCGNIGKEVVRLLEPFQCSILAHDIVSYDEFYAGHNVQPVALEDLLRRADVVSIHVPLNESTRTLLSETALNMMKPTAVLVNTARGGIVDEGAVKQMLFSGRLAGAAFDVFGSEPPSDQELLDLPNFLATPHIGGSAREAILAMGRAAIDQLDDDGG